jgi:thymidylate synthase (FAD)
MEFRLLDHGYVKLIESWGSDERVIEAARMSTDKGFEGWGPKWITVHNAPPFEDQTTQVEVPGDEKLLKFLWQNKHHTPFEMAGMIIEVQAPIFVFREWHRHRTQSYNELSARYTPLPDMYYVPSIERIMNGKQAAKNKQSSEAGFTHEEAVAIQEEIIKLCRYSRYMYEKMLGEGLARELARIVVPVGQYSRMRASANLRNWLAFLTLRQAPGAQWEIRQYADVVGKIIAEKFPRTFNLFREKDL